MIGPLRMGRIEFSTVFNKGPFKFGRKRVEMQYNNKSVA